MRAIPWASVLVLLGTAARSIGQNYCPPGLLTIHADFCHDVGDEFDAEIRMSGLTGTGLRVVGGQFFLEYSDRILKIVSVEAASPPSVFTSLVALSACVEDRPECTPELIKQMQPCCLKHERILIGVLVGFGSGTEQDSQMAKIRFRVISADGDPFIRFQRDSDLATTQLTTTIDAVACGLVDAEPMGTDLRDFAGLQNCTLGAGKIVPVECRCSFDSDGDSDVDAVDFNVFHHHFDGPGEFGCR